MVVKLGGWKNKNMSVAGRTIIVKSVAMAIPSYAMQTTLWLVKICDKLDMLVRKFWWSTSDSGRLLYLKAWDTICTTKCSGGLGIKRSRDMKVAFITKLGWRLRTDVSRFWVKSIRSKYLRGRRTLDFQFTTRVASGYGKVSNCVMGGCKRVCAFG